MEAVAAPIDISLRLEKDPWSRKEHVSQSRAIELLSDKESGYRDLYKSTPSIETIRRHWPDFKRVSIFCHLFARCEFDLGLPKRWNIHFTSALIANAQKTEHIRRYVAKYNEFQAVLTKCRYKVRPITAEVGTPKGHLAIELTPLTAEHFTTLIQ